MKKFFAILLGFIIGFYFFMPKKNLFYLIQNKLYQTYNIALKTDIKSNIFKLSLTNGNIYFKNIKIATFKNADIYPYIIYNKIEISNIKIPINNLIIYKSKLIQTITNPLIIKIKAFSNFAKKIYGEIDISKKEIKLYFNDIKNKSIKQILKKDKKGYYYYEKF
ncbi:hypothetical protein [Nautilia lithotrophica]